MISETLYYQLLCAWMALAVMLFPVLLRITVISPVIRKNGKRCFRKYCDYFQRIAFAWQNTSTNDTPKQDLPYQKFPMSGWYDLP